MQHDLHAWDLSPSDAIALQNTLASQLRDEPLDLGRVQRVAGVDVGVKNDVSQAAVVVVSYPDLELLETVTARRPTTYPYIPGLLTFREGPVLIDALSQLRQPPDVYLFDGMGRIHPRRMGIAAHMGLWLDAPTVGVGKTHLIGRYDTPAEEKGAYSPLSYRGDQLGVVLRTRTGVKPVYVSAGHRMMLDTAIELVLACTPRYRLPRPIRLAHKAAGQV